MTILSRMMLAAAATSMAVLPVAAEAGTRASQSSPTTSVSAPGKGRAAKGEKQESSSLVWAVIGFTAAGLAIWGLVEASSGSNSDCRSPGAC